MQECSALGQSSTPIILPPVCSTRLAILPLLRMKQLLRFALRSACLTLIVSSAAEAQKTYALGVGGGAAMPVGKLNNAQKTGYAAIASLVLGVADNPIGVRLDAVYNMMQKADVQGGTAGNADLRVVGVLANLVFAFPGTNAKAYILAGGGLYNSKPGVSGNKASQNNFGFNAGFGSTFGSGPFSVFIESRYHSVSRSPGKGVYQFVPITLGLLF
jgi:hypothetical protein